MGEREGHQVVGAVDEEGAGMFDSPVLELGAQLSAGDRQVLLHLLRLARPADALRNASALHSPTAADVNAAYGPPFVACHAWRLQPCIASLLVCSQQGLSEGMPEAGWSARRMPLPVSA